MPIPTWRFRELEARIVIAFSRASVYDGCARTRSNASARTVQTGAPLKESPGGSFDPYLGAVDPPLDDAFL